MAINPLIALQSVAPQLETPIESQTKALQLRALQNAAQVQDMEMQQRQRALADDDAARAALQADPTGGEGFLRALAGSGNTRAFAAAQKAALDAAESKAKTGETTAKTKETNLKALNQAFALHRDQINTVNDPLAAAAWVKAAYDDPALGPLVSQSGPLETAIARIPKDPDGFQKWKMQSALAAEEYVKRTTVSADTKATNDTSTENSKRTAATSRANNRDTQAAENERARLGRLATAGAPTYDSERGVLVDRTAGTARPVMQGGKPLTNNKPLTEFQGKSAAFGDRAIAADQILTELEGKYSPMAVNARMSAANTPLVGGLAGATANAMLSTEGQRAEQAQRDFVNAVLRQESGAAIAATEFDNAKKQYFPQPNDDQATIDQKAANRALVIEGFKRNAGPNATFTPVAPKKPRAPAVGTIQDGYKFKGGDPSKPESWERQ